MVERVWVNNKLIYLRKKSGEENFWDNHWSEEIIKKVLNLDKLLAIDEYAEVFGRYLNKDMLIVEAGCGPCRILHALKLRELKCIGIDNSLVLLQNVRKFRKDLDLAQMDIGSMAIGDSTCDAYISLGVMEHFPEGMQHPLSEAKRVLCPGGIIFLQVPHFNPLRRFIARCGRFRHLSEDKVNWQDFYQYALMPQEIREQLRENNFNLLGERYFRVMKGLKDEFPPLRGMYRFYSRIIDGGTLLRLLARPLGYLLRILEYIAHLQFIRKKVSHMMMFVAEKN